MDVKDPSGTVVVTLGDDDDIVDGYLATYYDEGERKFKRITTESNWVDGVFPVISSLDGKNIQLKVYIEGTDWADVTAKWAALRDAVEVEDWQLAYGAVTWICDRADSSAPLPTYGIASTWREVTLTIPV